MDSNQLFGKSVLQRVLWLYGAYMLLNNAAYRETRMAWGML